MATAPATKTPVKQATPAADKPTPAVPAAPTLNLSALKPVKVDPPALAPGRGARDNSIVEGWLTDLNATRKPGEKFSQGLAIQIPAGTYMEMRGRLNSAAAKLSVGVSIDPVKDPTKGEGSTVKPTDTITLTFAVKDRKKNKPKETPAAPEQKTDAPAEPDSPAEQKTDAPAEKSSEVPASK